MSHNKVTTRAASRRIKPSSAAKYERNKRVENGGGINERKMKSLQSLQDRLCFTLKRPRTSRGKGGRNSQQQQQQHRCAGGYGGSKLNATGKSAAIMESGLIQMPMLQCDYYESPSPLSMCSSLEQDSTAGSSTIAFTTTTCTATNTTTTTTTTSASSSACSSITHLSQYSPISSFDNNYTSSDDSFSSDEVMSLVSCPDMVVVQNVLDFIDSKPRPDTSEDAKASRTGKGRPAPADVCEKEATTLDQGKIDYPSSVLEEDGEPYRIDLCDFEPDVNALNSPPQEHGTHHINPRNYGGGGVLCLRLDYEDVLTALKERGESQFLREPIFYPSPYLNPFRFFGYTPFVPHLPF